MSSPPRTKKIGLAIVLLLVGAALGAAAGLYASGTFAPKPTKLVIAIQPTEAASEIAPRAKELEQFLETRLSGVDVEIYVPTTYAAVVEALKFGHADVGFMSAWPSLIASKVAGGEIGLAEVREVIIGAEKRNEPYYFSYWVVPKDSNYQSLSELRGKRACFPSPISTSGYVFPVARLIEMALISKPTAGEVDPRSFFGDITFGGGYGQCWQALKRGQVDVTVIAGDVSEKLYREVLENTRIVEKQGPIPSHAVVFSEKLKEPLRSKVIDALMELGRPEHRELMKKFISGIFVEFKRTTTEEHIGGLKKAIELTGFKFSERIG